MDKRIDPSNLNPVDLMKLLQDPKTMGMMTKLMEQIKDNPNMINDLLAGIRPTPNKVKKIQPNAKCPCGSEKKYKKCCHLTNKSVPEKSKKRASRKPTYTE